MTSELWGSGCQRVAGMNADTKGLGGAIVIGGDVVRSALADLGERAQLLGDKRVVHGASALETQHREVMAATGTPSGSVVYAQARRPGFGGRIAKPEPPI